MKSALPVLLGLAIFTTTSATRIDSRLRVPPNPCPDVFQYYKKPRSGTIFGRVEVPFSGARKMELGITASLVGAGYSKKILIIEKAASNSFFERTGQAMYNIFFPFINVIPRITKITYNGEIYCEGKEERLTRLGTSSIYGGHVSHYKVIVTGNGEYDSAEGGGGTGGGREPNSNSNESSEETVDHGYNDNEGEVSKSPVCVGDKGIDPGGSIDDVPEKDPLEHFQHRTNNKETPTPEFPVPLPTRRVGSKSEWPEPPSEGGGHPEIIVPPIPTRPNFPPPVPTACYPGMPDCPSAYEISENRSVSLDDENDCTPGTPGCHPSSTDCPLGSTNCFSDPNICQPGTSGCFTPNPECPPGEPHCSPPSINYPGGPDTSGEFGNNPGEDYIDPIDPTKCQPGMSGCDSERPTHCSPGSLDCLPHPPQCYPGMPCTLQITKNDKVTMGDDKDTNINYPPGSKPPWWLDCAPGTQGCPVCQPGMSGCSLPNPECRPGEPHCYPPSINYPRKPPGKLGNNPGEDCTPGTPGCGPSLTDCPPGSTDCFSDPTKCYPGMSGCDPERPTHCSPGSLDCPPHPPQCYPGMPGCSLVITKNHKVTMEDDNDTNINYPPGNKTPGWSRNVCQPGMSGCSTPNPECPPGEPDCSSSGIYDPPMSETPGSGERNPGCYPGEPGCSSTGIEYPIGLDGPNKSKWYRDRPIRPRPPQIVVPDGPDAVCGVYNNYRRKRQESSEYYPWVVAIMVATENCYNYKCTATLVSNGHVLTTARCVIDSNGQIIRPDNLVMVIGTADLENWVTNGAIIRTGSNIQIAQEYNPETAEADIAVITMDRVVEISETATANMVTPICLFDPNVNQDKTDGLVAGWGISTTTIRNVGDFYRNRLSTAPLTILRRNECPVASARGGLMPIGNTAMCAGDRNYEGPCIGDTGAVFMTIEDDKYYVRGIVSKSKVNRYGECARDKVILADIGQMSSWILDAMNYG